jgi:putative thioredoxin
VDENQGIASQLNIQSIPTVYGFVNGRPIDAFQGVQPESKIETMIDKMIDATPGNEIPKLINEAEELFKEKKYEEAQSAFENLIGMDPGNPKIIIGLLRCLMQLHKYDDAKEMFESLDDEILKNEEIIKIKKLLDNLGASKGASIEDIKLKLSSSPNNLDLRFELAGAYLSMNDAEKGFNELLEIFKLNSKWNDEAAKKKLLEFFDLLGPADPNVLNARKKLSSLMFK